MEYSMTKRKGNIFNKLWVFIVMITIFYAFYFQYSIKAISGLMAVLCGVLIAISIIQIIVIQRGLIIKSNMFEFLIFVFMSVIMTLNKIYGLDVGIRMLEYILVSYSIYLLLVNNPHYIEQILWCFCISITLLASTVLVSGVSVSSSGALGLESLNSNSMSSYFLIMLFCSFLILYRNRVTLQTIMLLLMDCIIVITQVVIASRRGFLVMVLFVFFGILFGIIPLRSNSKSRKRFFIYMFIILTVAVLLIVLQEYILDNTILGTRLLGSYDSGDLARARYQNFALNEFKKHPLFGIGIGGIAHYVGAYSHSMYYEIFSCTGTILSLVFLIGMFRLGGGFFYIRRKMHIIGGKREIIYISYICFVFWICLLISGIAVVMIYDFYFYFSIALLSVMMKNLKIFIRKGKDCS